MINTSIDSLKSVFSNRRGVASNNQFRLIMLKPPGVLGGFGGIVGGVGRGVDLWNSRDLSILCDSITMPGRNISTTEYTNGAQTLKTPYTFINSEVTASFIVTNDGMARKYFESWMEAIFDSQNYVAGYKEDYATDVEIQHLNKNEGLNIVHAVRLKNAFPTNINEYTLSNAEENSVSKIDVTFAYDNYSSPYTLDSLTKAIF